MNTIGQFHLMEVDEQPKRNIQQFHVAQELRFVDGQNLLHRLCFHQRAADQHIEAQRFFAGEAFIFYQHRLLTHTVQAAQPKVFRETPFADGFDQAGVLCRGALQWPQR